MPHTNNYCYEFGPFRVNVSQRVLTRDGEVIALTPKTMEVLLLLLRNAGELVGKDELMKEVWPDSFVEEGNLNQSIFRLRRALDDSRSKARYIETVVRRGYRFIAPLKSIGLNAALGDAHIGFQQQVPVILAVLPFTNATGDQDLDYLADGLGDNIINSLSQVSKLRVMSRTSVFRYGTTEIDPEAIARDLSVDVLLLAKIVDRPTGRMITAELVDTKNGWLLWGESFDCAKDEILEIQKNIVRQILNALGCDLSSEEEKRLTTRYTENSNAYQAYMAGRFNWSLFTRAGIEKAIVHFRQAIELDSSYALAYSGVVDCYLRLITNYFPPDSEFVSDYISGIHSDSGRSQDETIDPRVKLRHEWDWKSAIRELKRANELRANYPAAHQWHAAYLSFRTLYERSVLEVPLRNKTTECYVDDVTPRIPSGQLTATEEVQVLCTIAREQIDVGNYKAACLVLSHWWNFGDWPKLTGLGLKSRADLLLTAGDLSGFFASAEQLNLGQKNAEALISGAIALLDEVGSKLMASEARAELALCYYRQGNFDLARQKFVEVINSLTLEDKELRSVVLVRLASLERHAGRFRDALSRLEEAEAGVKECGPWVTGRHHLELASIYRDLAIAEKEESFFERSLNHHRQCLYEFQAIGNLRLLGVSKNNLGFLLVTLGQTKEAKFHLLSASKIFEILKDKVRLAQVDDTLARLPIEEHEFSLAEHAANRAIETLQTGDEDILLAEVLRTKGLVLCKQRRYLEAAKVLEWAYGVASRRGDSEGTGCSLLITGEELSAHLSPIEREQLRGRLQKLLTEPIQTVTRQRIENALETINSFS